MPQQNRPLWRRIICLDYIAIRGKHDEIQMSGWVVLLFMLATPLWIWRFIPDGLRFISEKIEDRRRAFYADIDISEDNTARTVLWRCTPGFLCRGTISSMRDSQTRREGDCRLLDLPYEIRRQIWLELLRPADKLFTKHDSDRRRLCATYEDTSKPPAFTVEANPRQYTAHTSCKDMSQLLKVNYQWYGFP